MVDDDRTPDEIKRDAEATAAQIEALEERADAQEEEAEAREEEEKKAAEYDQPPQSRLGKILGALPTIPELPAAEQATEPGTSEEDEEDEGEDDIAGLSKADAEYLFSSDDPMISPPTTAEMEDMAGTDHEEEGISREDQEAEDKERLEALVQEEKDEASTDEYLFSTNTEGVAGENEKPKPKPFTKYTVALRAAEERKRKRGGEVELGETGEPF